MKYKPKKTWGASVRGPSHVLRGLPNQDRFIIKQTKNGVVAVVADGLGSKRFSDKGSKEVCRTVVKTIKKFEKSQKKNRLFPINDIFLIIQREWSLSLKQKGYNPRHCSSTCLLVYISKKNIFTARLGDGMIFMLGKNEEDNALITDEKDDCFANTTYCLTSSDISNKQEISIFEKSKFSSIVLCTDGVSNDIEEKKHADFVKEIRKKSLQNRRKVNSLNMKTALLTWPVKGHSDDKTIVFIEV